MMRRLTPGEPGTKKYVEKYGEALICVRYRYDEARGIKSKTVELLVSEEPWVRQRRNVPENKKVYLTAAYHEFELRRLLRAAGAVWDNRRQRWQLAYGTARSLGLDDRIDWSM